MFRTCIASLFALLVSFCFHVTGQSQPVTPVAPVAPQVNVPFFATEHDKPAADVAATDIAILDNKRQQTSIAIRNRTELPLRLGVLISTSGMERLSGIYRSEVATVSDFLPQALVGSNDKAFVEKFGSTATVSQFLTRGELGPVTIDHELFGSSAFYDAVRSACDERMNKDPAQFTRKVIVIIGDGHDNASRIDQEEAIESAQQAGVVIFAVSTFDDPRIPNMHGNEVLEDIAAQTGGLAFVHLERKDLPEVFATIREQLQALQILSFTPADMPKLGERRALELKSVSHRKLKLRSPRAYYIKASGQ